MKYLGLPPLNLLRELFHYNAITGQFTYLIQRGPRKPGDPAGCTQSGIPYLWADGAHHRADSIAWALSYGHDPSPQHVHCLDGNPLNLALSNLALHPHPPVYRAPRGRRSRRPGWYKRDIKRRSDGVWVARCDGVFIGEFGTRREAIQARKLYVSEMTDPDELEEDDA